MEIDKFGEYLFGLLYSERERLEVLCGAAYMLQDTSYLNRLVIIHVKDLKTPDTIASWLEEPLMGEITVGDKLLAWALM